jgi:hypothetical protein
MKADDKENSMRKSTLMFGLLALSLVSITSAVAQDSAAASTGQEAQKPAEAPAHFYHLDIVLEQVGADRKPTNSRTYTTTVSTGHSDHNAAIRTGSLIPILTGSGKDGETTQWQYQDIGVNIDAQFAREVGSKLSLYLSAEVSSVADTKDAPENSQPTLNQNKWQGQVLVPVGKATVVFSSDDLRSKGAMQLVVTATLLQ